MSTNLFKAPYAVILAVLAVLAGAVLIWFTDLHESAFAYGSGIVSGFFVTAAIAAGVKAYRSALVMACCALAMLMLLAVGVDAETFKDMAFKGLASGAASGVIVVIKTLLDRFKDAM